MKNRIDVLIGMLRDSIQTGDGSLDCQNNINDKIQEAELVFENIMLYIIKGRTGFLLTVLGRSAPVALVRLNCNILLATLDKELQKPKGLTRFLKK